MLRSILVNGRMIHYDDPSVHHHSGEHIKEEHQTQPELTETKEENRKDEVIPIVDSGVSVFETVPTEPVQEATAPSVVPVTSKRKKKSRLTL